MARRRQTLFFKPKNPRLARAISITSPQQFRKSIGRVRKLKGISPTTKRRALVLAKNRANAQLKRRTLSAGERRQFTAISKIGIPRQL